MSISLPTFTRRETALLGRRRRRWAIYGTGLRREIRRPAVLFFLGLSTAVTTISSLVIVLLASFIPGAGARDLTFFFTPASSPALLFFVMAMAAVVGGASIADDLDSMALTLYLSRPLTAADYLGAKAAITGTLASLVAILSLVLTPVLGALLGFFSLPVALEATGISVLLGALLTGFFTSVSLFLSSLTRRRAYAASGLFAIILGLVGVESVLANAASLNNPAVLYLSPWEDFLAVARTAYGLSSGPVEWAVALAILLGITVLASLATWMRMQAIEVVSG